MSRKLDLSEHKRIAESADDDEWQWRDGVLEGVHQAQVVLYPDLDLDEGCEPMLVCSVSNQAHIAANSPAVVRALLHRIAVLERIAGQYASAENDHGDVVTAERVWRLLERGVELP